MKTLIAGIISTMLITSLLYAQRDITRQNTAPLGTDVFIRDLDANRRADGLVLSDQNVRLTEDFQQQEFSYIIAGTPVIVAFRAYPNPVADNLWLEVAGPELDFYVTLYDQNGRALGLVNRNVAGAGQWQENFNLSSLSPGAYVLVFLDANGNRLAAQQIIKQF
ncbi:MAG: T9SS type A sorting domain-containing protein [Saprospiraceae bacterium]